VLSDRSKKDDEVYIDCNDPWKDLRVLALVLRCDNADYLCALRCDDTVDEMKVMNRGIRHSRVLLRRLAMTGSHFRRGR